MSLYQEFILDHYSNPRNTGRLPISTKSITVNNPLCGDQITMDVLIQNNKVTAISFVGHGCVISQALASQLTEFAMKKSKNELLKLDKTFMIKLLGMKLGPNRLKCALLPLEALQTVLCD